MSQKTIDQALRNDRRITPSPDFARRVMRSVRTEMAERETLSFPWFLPIGALVVTAGLVLAVVLSGDSPIATPTAGRPGSLAPALAWLSTALIASLGLAWWSVRFAGRSAG